MQHPNSLSLEDDINTKDYSNPQVQNAFMMLPEADQAVLKNLHHTQANILNGPETIEIAGVRILARPIETIGMTLEQKEKFKVAGGLINPTPEESMKKWNLNKMMYWETDWKTTTGEVEELVGDEKVVNTYAGYELWKRIFPEYAHLSEQEARSQGLMMRYDRNHSAREDFAKNIGGRQTTREERERISAEAKSRATLKNPNAKNSEILREMGQKLLGRRSADDGKVCSVGEWSLVASSDLGTDGYVRGLGFCHDESRARDRWSLRRDGLGSVVVMANGTK